MLLKRIIPCLDTRAGRVVKGIRFQGLRDCGDPLELAQAYAQQGADELVVLDIGATPAERPHSLELIRSLRELLSIPITVGGGLRKLEDAQAFLEAGADRVAVNSAAVLRPDLLNELARRFGVQCVVLSLDAARTPDGLGWQTLIRSGAERRRGCALAWAREACQRGAGEIMLTSWDRDGTRSGYDLELLKRMRSEVSVPLIASGGAATATHMREAFEAGADACLAASLFHDGHTTVQRLKQELSANGLELRT